MLKRIYELDKNKDKGVVKKHIIEKTQSKFFDIIRLNSSQQEVPSEVNLSAPLFQV
jgi:hypothetical protein